MSERGNFGSKLGIILATAGSAVGLGNIWRFPYMTGQNGGAAFILIYIGCISILGIPGMVSEFIIGRHAASNAARAYRTIGGKGWMIFGYIGAFTSMIILGFYAVVAGWCLQYLFASVAGELQGDNTYVRHYFETFMQDSYRTVLWTIAFILLTHWVVVRGVRGGIEKFSKLLMPLLFILLILIVIAACMLPNSIQGITFLFKPDFSKVTQDVFLDALGQAFFSISLGTACLCTYASYFSRQTNLLTSAVQIASIDTLIAILAGLMIFPAAFTVGVKPDSGPALIFITLPAVFQEAFQVIPGLGYVISVLFYGLLVLAALTSTISMHEIGTALFYEELNVSRQKGAWIETIACITIGILCAISCNGKDIQVFGKTFLEACDFVTSNILLPLGGLATCILVGWIIPQKIVKDEFTNWDTLPSTFYRLWLLLIRIACPLCIIAIFLHQFGIL